MTMSTENRNHRDSNQQIPILLHLVSFKNSKITIHVKKRLKFEEMKKQN